MPDLPSPPRIWPTIGERLAWAKRETPEFHNWRKALIEGAAPTAVSLLILRRVLAPQDWRQEAIIGVVSLAVGLLLIPAIRFAINIWRAPRHFVQDRFALLWTERSGLRQQLTHAREKLDITVEIEAGPFIRPAEIEDLPPDIGKVYALQNVIITNRSDSNVSLSFELWIPWKKKEGEGYLHLREQEFSGMGRTNPRYLKGPLNIGPKLSSECKDIGFICLPGQEDFFGEMFEPDLVKSTLRVIDRLTGNELDVPVFRRYGPIDQPPGWPKFP